MPERPSAIGVDIGGTNVRAARVSATGEILMHLAEKSAPDPQIVVARVLDMVRRLDAPEVVAIGIGVPARIDAAQRRVYSGGFVDLSSVDIVGQLEAATGRPVVMDTDCNMALTAEMAIGAGRGRHNVVMFAIGTGIGGAVVANDVLLRGVANAGQLGHITVDVNGAPCLCGRQGCVETTSSGTALGRHIAAAGLPKGTTVDTLLARQDEGDSVARTILANWARPLRAAIDTTVALFDPDIVVLGGGLGAAAHRALAGYPARSPWYRCEVVPAELDDDAGVIGASLRALAPSQPAAPAVLRARGKRAVLVNGVPASGKSTISRVIADRTGWPLLTLDTIKDPFLFHLGPADRLFNRTLGRASYQAIWSLVADAPAGTAVVVDAWFGFQPYELLEQHLAMAKIAETAEIWCHAPGEIVAARYAARLDTRLPGHPGADYIPELVELAGRAKPVQRGPLYDVDTTLPFDPDALMAWLETVFPGAARG